MTINGWVTRKLGVHGPRNVFVTGNPKSISEVPEITTNIIYVNLGWLESHLPVTCALSKLKGERLEYYTEVHPSEVNK